MLQSASTSSTLVMATVTLPFIPRSSISRICRRQGIHALYITRRPFFVLFPHDLSSPPFSFNLAAHSFTLCLRILLRPRPARTNQSDSFYRILLRFYSTHQNDTQQPSVDALTQCFEDMPRVPGRCTNYLILDECPNHKWNMVTT